MPLDLAAALRRHLLQRFPADRDYPRAALHAAGMPPLIGAFLDRTLDRWVEIERAQIRSDWFDFENPDVQEAEARFFDTLTRTARIPAEAWKGTLGGAVDVVVRYLTTPARALTDAIFEGSADPLAADAVRARLPMFAAYPYFAEVGGAYLERKKTDTLEPPDLFGLLDRIDRRVVSEFGADEWVDLLAPLFALARQVPELDGVPAPLLKRFFEMKGEPDLAMPLGKRADSTLEEDALYDLIAGVLEEGDPLDVAVRTDGHTQEAVLAEPEVIDEAPAVEADEVVAEVEAAADAEPDAVEEPTLHIPESYDEPGPVAAETAEPTDEEPEAEAAAAPAPAPELEASEETAPDASDSVVLEEAPEAVPPEDAPELSSASDEDDGAVPLWQRYAADDANVNAQYGHSTGDPLPDAADDGGEEGAPLWKRFFGRSDEASAPLPAPAERKPLASDPVSAPAPSDRPARASSLEELERTVLGASTSGQRSRFVKHLFGGDAGKYATVLHALAATDTWTEASQIIARDVFRPFRINIYGEHAVAFTDAVEARFRT